MATTRHLTIEYCTVWNYYPRAAGLADEIQQKLGLTPQLVKSSGGRFDVTLGNDLIFSKQRTGRFPEPGEVLRLLEEKLAATPATSW